MTSTATNSCYNIIMRKNEEKSYHYGLELLRIVSMFMIVLTHILGKGGLREAVSEKHDWYYAVVWIIQIASYVAVNCYALLSGYVGVSSSSKISKIAQLWLQVVFYTVLVTCGFALAGYPLGLSDWVGAFFPVVTSQYWYITAYFGLLLVKPLLNKGLNVISDKELRQVVLLSYVFFCLQPALFNNKVLEYSLSKGFGMTWLVLLYIFGAYLKRIDITRIKTFHLFLVYLLSSILTFLGMTQVGRIWYWYPSPSLVLGSIALFLIFAKHPLTHKSPYLSLIKFLAPASLGVYLLHLHPLIEKHFLLDEFIILLKAPEWLFPITIILLALVIYLISTLIEWLRLELYARLKVSDKLKILDTWFS